MAKKETETNNPDKLFEILEKKYNAYFEPEKIRTGIIPLDLVLNGYLETGTLIELSGESQTGKSTLLMHLSKVMCEKGYKTVYIDTEGSVKTDQLAGIGLLPYLSTKDNKDNLFTLVKESGYVEVEKLIDTFLRFGDYKLFIIDSLSSLIADIYLDLSADRQATENRVGLNALMNSRFLTKLNALKTEYNCTFIFINQTRIDMSGYYSSFKSSGGQIVKFAPDVRLFMRLKEKILDKKELITGEIEIPIGANCTIEASKSRLGIGFVPYNMTVYFGKGISSLASYKDLLPNIKNDDGVPALEKLSTKSYTLHLPSGDIKVTQGKEELDNAIINNANEIEKLINDYLDAYYERIHKEASLDPSNVKPLVLNEEQGDTEDDSSSD